MGELNPFQTVEIDGYRLGFGNFSACAIFIYHFLCNYCNEIWSQGTQSIPCCATDL